MSAAVKKALNFGIQQEVRGRETHQVNRPVSAPHWPGDFTLLLNRAHPGFKPGLAVDAAKANPGPAHPSCQERFRRVRR